MESLFDKNQKLFRTTSLSSIHWHDKEVHALIKVLVVALLADSEEDLLLSSALSHYSPQQLKGLTRVRYHDVTSSISNPSLLKAETLTIAFPNDVYKPQSFTFIHDPNNDTKSRYKTLVMAHASSKLTQMLLHWMKTQYGVVSSPVVLRPQLISSCLDLVINGLPGDDKTRLGDLEMSFSTQTKNTALSTISLEVENKELQKLAELANDGDLLSSIMEFIQTHTSLEVAKLPLNRFSCNFMVMTGDGRLKLQRGIPTIAPTDVIEFTVWDIIQMIYQTL